MAVDETRQDLQGRDLRHPCNHLLDGLASTSPIALSPVSVLRYPPGMPRRTPRPVNFATGVGRPLPPNAEVWAKSSVTETIPAADREMVRRGMEQARKGELASEEEVRATLNRFRL